MNMKKVDELIKLAKEAKGRLEKLRAAKVAMDAWLEIDPEKEKIQAFRESILLFMKVPAFRRAFIMVVTEESLARVEKDSEGPSELSFEEIVAGLKN